MQSGRCSYPVIKLFFISANFFEFLSIPQFENCIAGAHARTIGESSQRWVLIFEVLINGVIRALVRQLGGHFGVQCS